MGNEQFISFEISKIFPEIPLPGDLYLYINSKFLKLKNAGDVLDSKKYELFLLKKIQYVFIHRDEVDRYEQWSRELAEKEKKGLVQAAGNENIDMVEQHLQMKGEVLSFVTKEVTEASVKEILDRTKNFVENAQQKKMAEKFLANLMSYGQSTADHSTNVANLAAYLAITVGYGQQAILENIYVGALLHDYGKTRINPKYLEDPTSDAYKKAMKKHPSLGKTALLLDSGFPDDVLRIIVEHHERFDGKGYPKGLKGNMISDLTKIVSIANVFDNLVMESKETDIRKRQRQAFKTLSQDTNQAFDSQILSGCLQAMDKVF